MSYSGFSVLAWVKPDCDLYSELADDSAKTRVEQQLLRDFCTLLSVRWNMELTIQEIKGYKYAYGSNPRITVSDRTLKAAIGELEKHVLFIRSVASVDAETLADYSQCRKRWKVPESVTDSSYGWDSREPAETSQPAKRKRF